jgi:hypothetical protein
MPDAARLPAGVTAAEVTTSRLRTHLLRSGPDGAPLLVLVHGNVSSGRFFAEMMAALVACWPVASGCTCWAGHWAAAWPCSTPWTTRARWHQIVSDASLVDLGHLGALGVVPGWPGPGVFPAQPMVGQIRTVLDRYRAAGGRYTEQVLAGCGHSPHLEHPDEFLAALTSFLSRAGVS